MKNEERKLEAIKKAYGIYYDQAKPSKDGWCKFGNISHKIFQELDMDGYSSFDANTVRPKSLTGIENNRKWIRIEEDGSNFPEFGTTCWTLEGGNVSMYNYNENTVELWKDLSHYQPIIKPESPLW